ncbi:MAG: ATP-grasp domain-containing protein [Pseudomonadota bacterium]
MRDVILLCPQPRDLAAAEAAGLGSRYRLHAVGPDLDGLERIEPEAVLAEADGVPADGIVATKDRSALLAAVLAGRRGLPSPTPQALLACQHKPTSRRILERVAPEATPPWAVLAEEPPPFGPPWFVKPVVGRLSQDARRVDDPARLASLDGWDDYREGYAAIAALAGLRRDDVRGYLAEEVRSGAEVTLEGYAFRGSVTVVGVTDSVKYPGTGSFERFEYPSRLPEERLAELADVASRAVPALGFDDGFFNVEFFVPERGPATLIEVNGRIASQFAPLVQAAHGRSTYEALFALACGDDPRWTPGPPSCYAVSYVLRRFEDAFVEDAPEPERGVEILVEAGKRLSEQGTNDAQSYRLAIVYAAAATRAEALARARDRADRLRFRLREPARTR